MISRVPQQIAFITLVCDIEEYNTFKNRKISVIIKNPIIIFTPERFRVKRKFSTIETIKITNSNINNSIKIVFWKDIIMKSLLFQSNKGSSNVGF